MKKVISFLLIITALLFCVEPVGKTTFWNNNDMRPILNLARTGMQYAYINGLKTVDTTSYTDITFNEQVVVRELNLVVLDTLEGATAADSTLFRVYCGTTLLHRKSIAVAGLGTPTAFGTVYSYPINKAMTGTIQIKRSRAAIVEGEYYWIIPYMVGRQK